MTSDFNRFSLSPTQLLDEVHDAQVALGVAEYYITHFPQEVSHCSTHHLYATHEALHEARRTIDRVIEMLRAEVGKSLQLGNSQPKPAL